jgi:phosphate transport system protein
MEVETDEHCLRILARWQPVASDLRFLTIALKMVTDLERIGDLAVNICERTLEFSFARTHLPGATLEEMTKITREMVHNSVDAFVKGSDTLAQQVIDTDDKVDDLYEQGFAEVLEVMQQYPGDLQPGIHALSVIKWVERIADHSTNLAELVVFMVRGKDIRHMSPHGPGGKLTG